MINGLNKQLAQEKSYSNKVHNFRKHCWKIFICRALLWMRQLKKDPVRKKMMHTKDALVENDYFDSKAATEAAVVKENVLRLGLYRDQSSGEASLTI